MVKIKLYCFTLWLLILLPCFIFAQTSLQRETNILAANSGEEVIHFGDLIDVDVIGSIEYDWRGKISPEGFLSGLDFVAEPIFALCQTEAAVAKQIEKGYSGLLRDPKVVVKILDRSGRAPSVLYGAVKVPQRFRIQRPVYLNELIVLSGGITERASGEIQIFRAADMSCAARNEISSGKTSSEDEERKKIVQATQKSNESTTYINLKISDLLAGKPEANPLIYTGDIITILEAQPIYIIGGVVNPRQISSRVELTLTRAIAAAGGLAKDANPNKIIIFRRSGRETRNIEVDLEAIKAEKSADVVLQAYDIIDVAQRGRDKRKFPPVIQNAGEAETNVLNLPLRIVD